MKRIEGREGGRWEGVEGNCQDYGEDKRREKYKKRDGKSKYFKWKPGTQQVDEGKS